MPVTYTYDSVDNVVTSKFSGISDSGEGMMHNRELKGDARLMPGYVQICDLTEIENFEFTFNDAREVTQMFHDLRARGYRGTVFLVETDLQFGVARMFKQMSAEWGLPIEITRDRGEVSAFVQKIRNLG